METGGLQFQDSQTDYPKEPSLLGLVPAKGQHQSLTKHMHPQTPRIWFPELHQEFTPMFPFELATLGYPYLWTKFYEQ